MMLFFQRHRAVKTLIGMSFPSTNIFYSFKFVFTKLPSKILMGPDKIIQCLFLQYASEFPGDTFKLCFQREVFLFTPHFSPYSMSPKSQCPSLIMIYLLLNPSYAVVKISLESAEYASSWSKGILCCT